MVKRLGRYEVLSELGRGGFGHVYRGLDPSVGRQIAIKVLNADGDEGMLTRFQGEAMASARLRHPNIVTVFDFGEQDGTPFIVMELLEGQDLQHVISGGTQLSILERLKIMAQIAAGLRCAHSSGIIHRDVKPANVMVLPDLTVKIMDFGIALVTQSTQSRQTPRGAMIGTLRYMAPEQFRGVEPDVRSDIFAYGLIFYELLTGVHPFHAAEAAAQMYNVLSVDPVRVTELCPECPTDLVPVIDRLLYKDPELRYQTLDDVLLDIEPVLQTLRQSKADELVQQALGERQRNQLDAALALVRQAMELDPANRQAREIREKLQSEFRREAVRPKVDDLLRRGREALARGNPAEAVQKFESAIRLDSTAHEIKALLQQAQEAVEKAREAGRLASDATRALRSGDPAAARLLALQALELHPADTARQVLAEADQALAETQRRARLADGLTRVRRLISIRSWEEASAVLNQLHQEFPNFPEFPALSRELRGGQDRDQREKRLAAGLDEARGEIKAGNLDEALAKLVDLAVQHPTSSDVTDMLRFVRDELETSNRKSFVQQKMEEAAAAGQHNQFDRAIEILNGALKRYPAELELQRERQRMEAGRQEAARRTACDKAIREAQELRSERRFPEALQPLDAFLASYSPDSKIIDLRETIQKEQQIARREAELRAFVQRAQQLLASGRYQEATELLQAPPSDIKNDPTVTMLRDEAKQKLKQQEERNAARGRSFAEAGRFREQHSYAEALRALEQFEQQYGSDPELEKIRTEVKTAEQEEARKREQQRRHEEAERKAALDAERQRQEAERKAALETERQRQEAERQAALKTERQRQEAERKAALEAERQRQEAERKAALETERQRQEAERKAALETERQRQEAERQAALETERQRQEAERQAALETERQRQEAERQAALEAQRQRQEAEQHHIAAAIEASLREVKRLRAKQNFDQAFAALDQGLKQFPEHPSLVAARQELTAAREQLQREQAEKLEKERLLQEDAARKEAERKQALEAALQKSRRHLEQQLFPDALAALDDFRARYGEDPEANRLRKQIKNSAQQEQREASDLVAGATDLIARDPEQAVAKLAGAPAHLRQRPEIKALEQSAVRAAEGQRLDATVEAILEEARQLEGSQEFVKALARLDRGLAQFPNQPKLVAARKQIRDARETHGREQSRRREAERLRRDSLSRIQTCLGQRQYKDALSIVSEALARDPSDSELLNSRQRIEDEQSHWIAKQAELQLEERFVQARDLIAHRPADAVTALENLSREHPGRSEFAAALAEARKAEAQQQRQELLAEVERMCASQEFDAALARLNQAWPGAGGEIAAVREDVEARRERYHQARAAEAVEALPRLREQEPQEALRNLLALPPAIRERKEVADAIQQSEAAVVTADRLRALEEVEQLFSERKLAKARKAYQEAVNRFGGNQQFEELLGRINAASQESRPTVRRSLLAGAALLGLIAAFGSWKLLHRKEPAVTSIPVEIRTDPKGASVHVAGQSCVTPNCRLSLAPGRYEVQAELNGYRPAQGTFQVAGGAVSGVTDLTLQPIPPPAPVGRAQAIGTIVVDAGLPDALVVVDNAPAGRTDASGKFTSPLPPAAHLIRVEKNGYEPALERRVAVAANKSQTVVFKLAPQIEKEARTPPTVVSVPKQSSSPVGKPPEAPKRPPPPAAQAPAAVNMEEQAWNAARVGNNPSEVQGFLDKYPNSQHVAEAQARLDALYWSATNPNDPASLRSYMNRFPNGSHRRDVQSRLAEFAWNAVDKQDPQALRSFLQQNSDNPHRADAQAIIDQLEKRAEADRLAQEQAKKAAIAKPATVPEINAALNEFNLAWEKRDSRDLRAVWPGVPKRYLDAMNQPSATLVMTLRPTGAPVINGDTGTIACSLSTKTTDRSKVVGESQRAVNVTLRKNGGRWLIVDPFAAAQ